MTDREAQSIRVADKDQRTDTQGSTLADAQPDRGDLLTADQYDDSDFDVLTDDEELNQFDETKDQSLNELIKDPYSRKKQMLTPQ